MSHYDAPADVSPLANAPVRLDLNSADFQLGRSIQSVNPNYASETQLPSLSYSGETHHTTEAAAHHAPGHHNRHESISHHQYHHVSSHHETSHHHEASHHHETSHHHESSHHHNRPHTPHQYIGHLSPEQIAAIRESGLGREHGAGPAPHHNLDRTVRPSDARIAPSRDYSGHSADLPFAPSMPGNNAWTERVLGETVATLEGKSPQILERALDPRLGCARCVTQFGHRAYGLPITDSVANLESSMQARNFVRVPMTAETMAHMEPGDIIVGHRNGTLNGAPLHGHTAVYMGDGKIFNNNALTKTMITESLSAFQQPLYDRNGRMHMNGYSDVWIYRPRTGNS